MVAAPLLKRTSETHPDRARLSCAAAAVLLLAVPDLVADLAGVALAGLVGPWVTVATVTAIQRRTPSDLLGRVSGAFELSLTIPQVTSIGLGAALIAVVSYRLLLVAVAVVAAVAVVFLFTSPEIRQRPSPAEALVAEAAAAETNGADILPACPAAMFLAAFTHAEQRWLVNYAAALRRGLSPAAAGDVRGGPPRGAGWPGAPGAYLRLSEAYDDEAAEARDLGWPVTELDSHLLALLTDPGTVVAAVLALIGALTREGA